MLASLVPGPVSNADRGEGHAYFLGKCKAWTVCSRSATRCAV